MNTCCTPRQVRRAVQVSPELAALLQKRPTPRTVEIPSAEAVAKERERLQYKKKYNRTLRSTIYALLVVAALAVLVATIFLPVLAHELSE